MSEISRIMTTAGAVVLLTVTGVGAWAMSSGVGECPNGTTVEVTTRVVGEDSASSAPVYVCK